MNKFNIGDRFYFYKNLSTSDSVKVGYKGIVDELMDTFICSDGWAFQADEIKPIIQTQAILGCNHKVYHTETGLCAFCDKKVI